MAPIRYPKELKIEGRKFYQATLKAFNFEDAGPHDFELLRQASVCLDRISEAQAQLKKDGAYFIDRWNQPKQHPAHAVERDNRVLFARLCRELNLSVEKPEEPRLPPVYR